MKPHIKYRLALAIALAFAGLHSSIRADDWPLVRGDIYGTGVARGMLSDAPVLLWKYSAGEDAGFDATTVVADGVVYVGDSAGTFHAIRLADGGEVWKKEFPETGFGAGAAVEKGDSMSAI
jgi:hypothetical protein